MIDSHAIRKYKRESAGCLILDFLYEHETGPIFTERRRLQGESGCMGFARYFLAVLPIKSTQH